jgi:hypothetical protein
VPVPVHKGYETETAAMDLEFQQYINVMTMAYNGIVRYGDHAVDIDHSPLRGRQRLCPFKFVAFIGSNVRGFLN